MKNGFSNQHMNNTRKAVERLRSILAGASVDRVKLRERIARKKMTRDKAVLDLEILERKLEELDAAEMVTLQVAASRTGFPQTAHQMGLIELGERSKLEDAAEEMLKARREKSDE